jgi:hypothetical protein
MPKVQIVIIMPSGYHTLIPTKKPRKAMDYKYLRPTQNSQPFPILTVHDSDEMSALGYAAQVRMHEEQWASKIVRHTSQGFARLILGTEKHEEMRNLQRMSRYAGGFIGYSVSLGENSAIVAVDTIRRLASSPETQEAARTHLGQQIAAATIETMQAMHVQIEAVEQSDKSAD